MKGCFALMTLSECLSVHLSVEFSLQHHLYSVEGTAVALSDMK